VAVDEPSRHAVVFQFEVPATTFTAGTYTCQINIIDVIAGRVASENDVSRATPA
jgi:hypothetical protein